MIMEYDLPHGEYPIQNDEFPSIYTLFHKNNYTLFSPLDSKLEVGKEYLFDISAGSDPQDMCIFKKDEKIQSHFIIGEKNENGIIHCTCYVEFKKSGKADICFKNNGKWSVIVDYKIE